MTRRFGARPLARALALLLSITAACAAERYGSAADREVELLLREQTAETLGGREETVLHPVTNAERAREARAPGADPDGTETAPAAAEERARASEVLSLSGALEIAVRSNRSYIAEKESLYLSALALTGVRYEFSPRVEAALSYLYAGGDALDETHAAELGVGVAQRLPWGGEISATAASGVAGASGEGDYGTTASIRLTQPLLRGAGNLVAWEALRQAERSLIYEIRGFELFRESFSIDVARRFYELVGEKQALLNQRRNLAALVFSREQAEALFGVGIKNQLEVLRARRSELLSRNSLIAAEEALRVSLERFRIFLGLPDTVSIDVQDEEPPLIPVDYAVDSAIEVALENRLDWLNRQDQLEDARRGVRIARDGLLPDLALDLGYGVAAPGSTSFTGQELDQESYRAGVVLEIPLQRTLERNAWRASQIELANATRALAEFRDELKVELSSSFRELARRRESIAIQTELIADQERNVEIAQLLLEKGEGTNRDVLEAEEALLEARNALIFEKFAYEIGRLGLLKDLGILFIDERGMWNE